MKFLSSDNGSGSLDHNTSELDLAMKNSSNIGLNKFGSEDDPYGVPREMGILKDSSNIPSKFRKLTVLDIVDRIKEQRERFEKKFAKKKKAEDEYYKQRYNKK